MISRTSLREEVGRVVGVEVSDEFAYPLLHVFPQERTMRRGFICLIKPGMSCVNFLATSRGLRRDLTHFRKETSCWFDRGPSGAWRSSGPSSSCVN